MRSRSVAFALALTACAIGWGAAWAGDSDPAQLAAARAVTKDLAQKLKSELMRAMAERGPIAAIEVCKTMAPLLADKAGTAYGLTVRRTALRVRNPANAPDEWERTVLLEFAAQLKAGVDPAKIEHAETVTDATGASEFRYMRAIPMMATPCLACHGAPEPSLKKEIARLYPQDRATGFKPGDLRGAYSVRAPAAAQAPPIAPAPAPALPRAP
jgi:hypothetical protein